MRIGVVFAAGLVLALAACADAGPPRFQGYAEGDLIFVGPEEAGRVTALHVDEGDEVKPGTPLFEVDAVLMQDNVKAATADLEQARARVEDVKAAAQRPEEVAVLEAGQRRAQAALDLSAIELDRQKDLFAKAVGSKAALDTAQHTFDQNQAALEQTQKQIEVARMGSRDKQIEAAEKAFGAAEANLSAAQTRLDRRSLSSSVSGTIETVYFRPGEFVPVGRPVVSILPPELIKLRFFVPETALARFKPGTKVRVSCDGCAAPIPATVSFISSSAEYTPPVIYSLDERSKLVFMLEAKADTPGALRPGQPITVEIAP